MSILIFLVVSERAWSIIQSAASRASGRSASSPSADHAPAPSAVKHQVSVSARGFRHPHARPIYHRRQSIDAHLTIGFAALAVTRLLEEATGWSIRRFVRTTRRYRTVQIAQAPNYSPRKTPSPTTSRTHSLTSTGSELRTN
jgi:hypothetical protein